MDASPKNTMQYVPLGNSGLKVSRVILGCMPFGTKKWEEWVIEDQEEVNKHIKFAYDNGVQTFDTANTYSAGQSEVVLGRAIKQLNLPREELVIMTKVRLRFLGSAGVLMYVVTGVRRDLERPGCAALWSPDGGLWGYKPERPQSQGMVSWCDNRVSLTRSNSIYSTP